MSPSSLIFSPYSLVPKEATKCTPAPKTHIYTCTEDDDVGIITDQVENEYELDKNLAQHQISMLMFVAFACGCGMFLFTKLLGIMRSEVCQ
ncbi:uncharacterized protein LOC109843274 isoform X2 [Asparagus officinalis]|uniref:uncharacterized protein LOC109843274 isoform X2 n=1 Tax=Asparagus officinalis TaxID=4686 RepID=UPI00098E4592|nr:uncharacterized protein LOC109843274 isoform X2 [Asparagus officinalis]